MNQIITVPDIAIVKTVDGTKKLLSLRDQKIKKDTLHTFGAGSGVKYNGDLYVLDDIIEPIVRMVSTKDSISCTVEHTGDIDVDWGDGTREKNVFSHTYMDGAAEHEIVFWGEKNILTRLSCRNNQLISLDVSNSIALKRLECDSNQLMSLDISKNIEINMLYLSDNPIDKIDTSHNKELQVLFCGSCQIATLDVSKNPKIYNLTCSDGPLVSLNASGCSLMQEIFCVRNQLSELKINGCTSLIRLSLDGNEPLIANKQSMIALADSLPQREKSDNARLQIDNPTSEEWIQDICATKNWTLL